MIIDKEFEKELIKLDFFKEEVKNDFLVDINRKKIWAVELDLLRKFISVCEKYDLKYFADSGTLLGAVRHKGFIPWDDDIDIVMPRDDYDKLIAVAKQEFDSPYIFQCPQIDRNYHRNHAQIRNITTTAILKREFGMYKFNQGIFIDIFPLDTVPTDNSVIKKYMRKSRIYNIMRRIKYTVCSKDRKIFILLSKTIGRLIPSKALDYDKFEKFCGQYRELDKGWIDKFTFREGKLKHLFNKEWYKNSNECQFEMINISIPIEYDNILKKYYGNDYIIPKRLGSDHGELIIDTDIPFDIFINKNEN